MYHTANVSYYCNRYYRSCSLEDLFHRSQTFERKNGADPCPGTSLRTMHTHCNTSLQQSFIDAVMYPLLARSEIGVD